MTVLEIYLEILTNFFEILYPPLKPVFLDIFQFFLLSACDFLYLIHSEFHM